MKSFLLILILALVESVSYVGFVRSHFYIPSIIIYLVIGAYALFNSHIPLLPVYVKKYLYIATILVACFFLIISLTESFTYPNFIYSHLHINLQGFTIFTLITLLISFQLTTKNLLFGALAFLFLFNLVGIIPLVIIKATPLITHSTSTYSDKMVAAYGDFYLVMQQVRSLTPNTATIIIPPQSAPWVDEGNDALVRRFLYPRNIVHLEQIDLTHLPLTTYALISIGHWPEEGNYTHGWPKVTLPTARLWQLFPTENLIKEVAGPYDPTSLWDWGLIEVRYD